MCENCISLIQRIAELEQELEAVTSAIRKKPSKTARDIVSNAIKQKINGLHISQASDDRFKKRRDMRKITDDLKWHLKIRKIDDITDELLSEALRYVEEYNLQGGKEAI